MKEFAPVRFDATKCWAELRDFECLLEQSEVLSEASDILPFFRSKPQLTAFLGSYNPAIARPDLIAYEYPLYGDLRADVIVGDSQRSAFCFIEMEDARPESVFSSKGRRLPEWSRRFEHGFDQIVDWLWKLADFAGTSDFEMRFGARSANFLGLLVAGRSNFLSGQDRERLDWRRARVLVDSRHIYCCTYDELLIDLKDRLTLISGNDAANEK